jgi:hypothetical protein
MAYHRILAAGNYPGSIGDIDVRVDATVDRASGEVRVAVAVKPDKLRVVEREGMHLVELDVAVFNGDERERLVSQLWQRIDLKLSASELADALSKDIRYTLTFKAERAPAHVKVIVYDHASDLLGSGTSAVK